jgi:hypothetical protein
MFSFHLCPVIPNGFKPKFVCIPCMLLASTDIIFYDLITPMLCSETVNYEVLRSVVFPTVLFVLPS